MENKDPSNYGFSFEDMTPEQRKIFHDKYSYAKRLSDVLEEIRTAALGLDPQSQMELRNLSRKVIDKLHDVNKEIKTFIKQIKAERLNSENQGKLF